MFWRQLDLNLYIIINLLLSRGTYEYLKYLFLNKYFIYIGTAGENLIIYLLIL